MLGFTLDLDALSSQEDTANPGVPLTQIVGIEEQMQLAMQLSSAWPGSSSSSVGAGAGVATRCERGLG